MTRNLLVLIPLTWAFSSGIGTLTVGFVAGWTTVLQYVVIVAIQIAIIIFMARNRPKTDPISGVS